MTNKRIPNFVGGALAGICATLMIDAIGTLLDRSSWSAHSVVIKTIIIGALTGAVMVWRSTRNQS